MDKTLSDDVDHVDYFEQPSESQPNHSFSDETNFHIGQKFRKQ